MACRVTIRMCYLEDITGDVRFTIWHQIVLEGREEEEEEEEMRKIGI